MMESTAELYNALANSMLTSTNSDVYDKKATLHNPPPEYGKVPHHVYLYYFAFKPDGEPDMRQYDYHRDNDSIPRSDVPGIINDLASNARVNGSSPTPTPCDFRKLEWTRISYVAIVMDSAYWSIWQKNSHPSGPGIVFDTLKGSTPNHSFYDAEDITVRIDDHQGQIDTRSGIFLINHMKCDTDGNTLGTKPGDPNEYFKFDLLFDVRAGGSALPLQFIIDPGGTNMGPPQPPPY
jgi:hypothetical protein